MFQLSYRVIKSMVFCAIYLLLPCNTFVLAVAPHLDFPAGTPGRCVGCVDCTVSPPPAVSTRIPAPGTPQIFEHFTLQDSTGVNADIYFPIDSRQPTTPDAAVWSCANMDANNINSPITVWYANAFSAYNFGFAAGPAPQAPGQIMVLVGGTPVERAEAGRVFCTIAANPLGEYYFTGFS
jgi:hypothetical protein